MSGTASYLYAISRPIESDALAGLVGLDAQPVRAITDGELTCLVSTVALTEFGEQALRANLEDLAWLERVARTHDEVIAAVAKTVTVAPLRLATICTDDDAVRARLHRLHVSALELLARLDGRLEWGVQLFGVTDAGRATTPDAGTHNADASGTGAGKPESGTDYLRRRRAQLQSQQQLAAVAADDADQVYASLADVAVAGRRHRPQDARLRGSSAPMLLNAAFLVDSPASDAFRTRVGELAATRPDGAVVLTGPWPPYSFAELEPQ